MKLYQKCSNSNTAFGQTIFAFETGSSRTQSRRLGKVLRGKRASLQQFASVRNFSYKAEAAIAKLHNLPTHENGPIQADRAQVHRSQGSSQ